MQLSGFKNKTGIRAWILSHLKPLTGLSGDVRGTLQLFAHNICCSLSVLQLKAQQPQHRGSFRSKIIMRRIIAFSPPKRNASKWNSKWRKQKRGKKKTSFLIGNLNCWRQSLSLGIFCISHTQNRCAISPITYLQSCSSYLVLSVLLMTQAIPDRAKATEEVQDTSYPRGSNATVFESFSGRVSNTNSME